MPVPVPRSTAVAPFPAFAKPLKSTASIPKQKPPSFWMMPYPFLCRKEESEFRSSGVCTIRKSCSICFTDLSLFFPARYFSETMAPIRRAERSASGSMHNCSASSAACSFRSNWREKAMAFSRNPGVGFGFCSMAVRRSSPPSFLCSSLFAAAIFSMTGRREERIAFQHASQSGSALGVFTQAWLKNGRYRRLRFSCRSLSRMQARGKAVPSSCCGNKLKSVCLLSIPEKCRIR